MAGISLDTSGSSTETDASTRLKKAVHRPESTGAARFLEKAFTLAFSGLVYPQIWEDPVVDMEALQLGAGKRLFTIASGGCNIMSYLTADPAEIVAVDLNPAHVALNRLKLAAAAHLPTYQLFYRFFGDAAHADNPRLYREILRDQLDADTRAYWDSRDWTLWPRIHRFRRGFYRYGLLGRTIMAGHLAADWYGVRLSRILEARNQDEQREIFDAEIGPLFDKATVRWLTRRKASLFGLGIPPAQYDALAESVDGGDGTPGHMADVLKSRLRKLLCDFPIEENYFAWQAVAKRYASGDGGPLPLYLQSEHFADVKARAGRVSVENASATDRLGQEGQAAFDAYLLLDAQDWMSDEQLTAIWSEVTRTARPGARVVFRTAAQPSILPGRVPSEILDRWRYDESVSQRSLTADRSAIYGGVHLYIFEG